MGGIKANGHGGARIGAGRKKVPLKDRVEDDFYKKKIGVIKIDDGLAGAEMPEPSKYLSQQTKGASENIGKEVYEKTWKWLQERGCDHLVNPQIIEQYAICVARWIQAENAVHTFGFLAKHPTTEMPIASPYIRTYGNSNMSYKEGFEVIQFKVRGIYNEKNNLCSSVCPYVVTVGCL